MFFNRQDTAGQERFHALGPIYYRDSNGALLVYDITDKVSFLKVKNWVKELRKMLGTDIVLCIAGNKCDLEKNRNVSLAEAEAYAESVGAKHYSTSAKLNKGVEDLFLEMSQKLISRAPVQSTSVNKPNTGLRLEAEEAPSPTTNQGAGGGCPCG